MISVLYVDDDPLLLDIGKIFLERSGNLSVDIISSGPEALELLEHRSYDVIISDYEMPRMDGIEFLKIVRERYDRIPFILFTGRGREEVAIKALNNGADSYLQKGGNGNAQFMELENSVKKHAESRRAEIALENSEIRYRVLVDNAQEGILVIQDELVVFHNQKFIDMFQHVGVLFHKIQTRSLFDFFHPDDQELMRERFYRRIRTGEKFDRYPFRIMDVQGSVHWFEVDAVVTEWNGSPATLNFIRDITEQHNLKLIVHESENRFQELVDSLPKTILEMDRNLNLTFINKACTTKFGYTPEDLKIPLSAMNLVISSDREKLYTHKIAVNCNKSLHPQEYTARNKDGSTFPVKVYLAPIFRNHEFAGFRAVCVDISEEKIAKSSLLQTNKQLNLMTKITRHDILNKTNALFALQALSRKVITDPVLSDYLEKQQQITKKIQQHIEFTRYYQEIGAKIPEWQDVQNIFLSGCSENDIGFISLDIDLKNYVIYADPLLHKVFSNIIENSIRHGDHVTKIGCRVEETGQTLTIIYTDDGTGIPSEMKDRIFDEGYGHHTGYGLFLIREILFITGITIVENGTFGYGARFEIVVPKGRYRIERDTYTPDT